MITPGTGQAAARIGAGSEVLGFDTERSFAAALRAGIIDPALSALPPVGSVDQFADSTTCSRNRREHAR